MRTLLNQILFKMKNSSEYIRRGYHCSMTLKDDGSCLFEWNHNGTLSNIKWDRIDNIASVDLKEWGTVRIENGTIYKAVIDIDTPYNDQIKLRCYSKKIDSERTAYFGIVDTKLCENGQTQITVYAYNNTHTPDACIEVMDLDYVLTNYQANIITKDEYEAHKKRILQSITKEVKVNRHEWSKYIQMRPCSGEKHTVYEYRFHLQPEDIYTKYLIESASFSKALSDCFKSIGIIEGDSVVIRYKDMKPPKHGILKITYRRRVPEDENS